METQEQTETVPEFDPIGAWDKWHTTREVPWGMGLTSTYKCAAQWLDAPDITVEDWGGGTGFAKQYFENAEYVLVDGSQSQFVSKLVDLRTYTSSVECILLRHVLEHNHQWSDILDNLLKSYTRRACIVLFTPLGKETKLIRRRFPSYSFRLKDLTDRMGDQLQQVEEVKTEHVLYLQK